MSYQIFCDQSSIRIGDEKKALAALKKEHKKVSFLDYRDDENDFEADLSASKTFEEFMANYGWEIQRDEQSKICAMKYDGPMPDHIIRMLETLAPFVEDGSYLEFLGDDDLRCDFKKGLLEVNGEPSKKTPSFPEPSVIPPAENSFGPENSSSFTIRNRSMGRIDFPEVIGRVHIADLSTFENFPLSIIEQINQQRMRDYIPARLVSITLTGVLSAQEFAAKCKEFLEANLEIYLFKMG